MSKHIYTIDNTHPASTALRFAKFKKEGITPEYLRYMNPKRFSNAPNAIRMLNALVKHGLMSKGDNNLWCLTQKGIRAVEELNNKNVRIRIKNV